MQTSNNYNFNLFEKDDKLKNFREPLNENFKKIDSLISDAGINIYISDTLPEIENRKNNTFYFKVLNEKVESPDKTSNNYLLDTDGNSIQSTEGENILISN